MQKFPENDLLYFRKLPGRDIAHQREKIRAVGVEFDLEAAWADRSLLKVAVQVRSRSALENSQLPIIRSAESPSGDGVCANATPAGR